MRHMKRSKKTGKLEEVKHHQKRPASKLPKDFDINKSYALDPTASIEKAHILKEVKSNKGGKRKFKRGGLARHRRS
tara:strand:+ start:109 stop:336 length:228 start_codon:yes stop_codon:yes gene_type:complete